MSFNKITREVDGVRYSISVQHIPGLKRPVFCVEAGKSGLVKVGEITNEGALVAVAQAIFHDAKEAEE